MMPDVSYPDALGPGSLCIEQHPRVPYHWYEYLAMLMQEKEKGKARAREPTRLAAGLELEESRRVGRALRWDAWDGWACKLVNR